MDHIFHASFDKDRSNKTLETFIEPDPHRGWALWSVSRNVQKWFEKNQLSAVAIGSNYPDVKLPLFDFDYRGVCRHATGNLFRLGHRRILLLMPLQAKEGTLQVEAGFAEAFQYSDKPDVERRVIFVRKDPKDLQKKLKQAFRSVRPPPRFLLITPKWLSPL